jgi:hypothetical protein
MIRRPYIGIAGITSAIEIDTIVSMLPPAPPGLLHNVAFGVLATLDTLNGKVPKKPARYPPKNTWPALILPSTNVAMTLIHYGYKGGDPNEQLALLQDAFPSGCSGIQWNAPLEAIATEEHAEALACWAGLRVVLHLRLHEHPSRLHLLDDLVEIVHLHMQHGAVTDVLLDASAGKGISLDIEYTYQALKRLERTFSGELGIGVAGGLTPNNLDVLVALTEEYPLVSLDVETGVRGANDALVPSTAIRFIEQSRAMLARNVQ